ncbi:ABC protein [Mycena leptocephala]|nr:ABC protein [Mycena leptocephala]
MDTEHEGHASDQCVTSLTCHQMADLTPKRMDTVSSVRCGKTRTGWASRQIPWASWSSGTGRASSRLPAQHTSRRPRWTWFASLHRAKMPRDDIFRPLVVGPGNSSWGLRRTQCVGPLCLVSVTRRQIGAGYSHCRPHQFNQWQSHDPLELRRPGHMFWEGGVFKVSSTGPARHLAAHGALGPLLVKALINFAKAPAAAAGMEPANIGHSIGMAFGLLVVIAFAGICQHQFFFRSIITGRRAVHLTAAARLRLPNSAVLNHVSTDMSRVDACAQWFHAVWTAPIQMTLGPSALAGFVLFLLIIPLQEHIMAHQAGRVLEVVASMRVVKYFCYEGSLLLRLFRIRTQELRVIREIQHSQSAKCVFFCVFFFIGCCHPAIRYSAVVFTSFSLFQLLRQSMMFLPRTLSPIADARDALAHLSLVFRAPLHEGAPFVNPEQEAAVWAKGAGWVWEAGVRPEDEPKEKGKGKENEEEHPPEPEPEQPPFALHDITLSIPRGTLVAIVGRVGSGNSSLLQGLIGEMRTTGDKWTFGGSVAYCLQSAWIQNATLRDNVLFGQPFEEERYWRVIEDSCLLPDLQLLADGDLTEIGEKGINLSGGQKQRVNIARALYYGTDVVIFDDPLSAGTPPPISHLYNQVPDHGWRPAVDANVGKALFRSAIQGLVSQGKTVILVTHALHFLAQCDYIYTLDRGRIAEAGTYPELIASGGEFARLDREFGGAKAEDAGGDGAGENGDEDEAQVQVVSVEDAKARSRGVAGTGKIEGKLIVKERRTTGGVAWSVYGYYAKAGGGWLTVPVIVLAAVLMQGSQVANSYVLVWWQGNSLDKPFSFYQILYALLGISQATFTYLLGLFMDFFAVRVSKNLHHQAIVNIFHAPMSFFGIFFPPHIFIFGKDIDSMDILRVVICFPVDPLAVILVLAQVLSSVIVVTVLEHYFIVAAVLIIFGFSYFLQFYRASALEMKRLDSMLRSILYAHLSESLTGLPTIRSYGEIERFMGDNIYYIDLENRALFLTVTNQRWLAVRLDALGSILVFLVAIFAAVGLNGVNPAEIGLILTYTTTLTQMFAVSTRLSAEVENYMNSVERVVHYARGDVVPQEAAHESTPQNKPAADWPAHGAIEFKDVTMAYRPGLPNVLHGISLKIHAGEKIGVVGRTGAGKSSLTLCLLRIVEYLGEIIVDGRQRLTDLRSNIAIIPQEVCTVRTALDPFSKYDDARLWDALRRSYLVETRPSTPTDSDAEPSGENRHRLTLDSTIETDGQNLSVGERSLLSLARALVKDSHVVILDEATASVDLETDNKIQRTIQTQFKDRTLICIAHRLRTIISYDRILVLDAGKIAEFDTPLNLFNRNESLFRSLCDKSNITSGDIEKAIISDDVE